MKTLIILMLISLVSGVRVSLCQVENNELIIVNESLSDTLFVSVSPIGFVFAGDTSYRPNSRWNEDSSTYLFGGNKKIFNDLVNSRNRRLSLNHDILSSPHTSDGSIGYGKYRVIILLSIPDTVSGNYFYQPVDSITIDYSDRDYPYGPSTNWTNFSNDFLLYYYDQDSILAQFKCSNCRRFNIDSTDKAFELWNQFVNNDSVYSKVRNRLGFISNPSFTTYPIISDKYSAIQHDDYGNLYLDFNLNHSVTTLDTLLDFPTSIVIGKHAAMKIAAGRTFEMITPSNTGDSAYTDLVVGDSAFLILYSGSRLIVHAPNRLTLKNMSNLTLALGSAIIFKAGSAFCRDGGRINGFRYNMIFEKGTHNFDCDFESPLEISDSGAFVLNDSAVISLSDNFTLHLSGHETALILNPGSKLLFGENSGIVCDSGARIIANDATFASADSTKKWNGISLNDPSHDTIRNCTIKNAMYGIALSGKYDADESPEPYSTEISGCSFINQTSYVLNNAIYLDNSAHVLVKDNTVSSANLSIGFTHGIYAEYCPGEMLNIISNSINNCNNGITIIQSSPYIAFNTLNGNSYGESGMFLDNSNGTIKYNVISDFYNSYYSFYSSPDLLKNTFDNSCDDNIYFSSSSVPVMHPLVSSGSTYWFAGDNLITGSPYDAGILFDEDAYPDINYGYNRFTLSGSNYYISGVNPASAGREFYVYENYWGEVPPDSLMFNITGADVKFNPYDDNSQTARQTNTFDTTDIGFGLKDTIHILESDNTNSAQELYLLAYQSEFNGEYEAAIGYYKEIASDYKDSSNASSCLARIFNCYDKKQASTAEYLLLESYYTAITEDTSHSIIMRNISEDLAIQSNIKQGNIEEAISDYDEIYANNTNTPKGFHALINREILSAGTGDNLIPGNTFEEIDLKQSKINALLKSLNGNDKRERFLANSTPGNFSLSQNFPNPFNPVTTISYDLPNSGFVTLKVYDMLGREVKTLVNEMKTAGHNEAQFTAEGLATGAYFYRLSVRGKAGEFVAVRKCVVVK